MNEDQNVEYKSEFTNKLKREIVSFLNTNGGTIYLGVDDKTHNPLAVSESQKHEWEEKLNHWYMNAFYPTPFSLIDILPNEKVFTIKVRPGRHVPYAIDSEGYTSKGVYIRYGSSAVKATNEQIKRMLQQNSDNNEFDSEMSVNQNLNFSELKKRSSLKNVSFSIKALHMLKESSIYNNAAFLVSDENDIITKVAIYQGTNVMVFKDKREIKGALTSQIDELLYFISLNNHTKIKIDGAPQRHETKDYPEAAVREAVVNAFAHRDYLLHSTIKVEIFDDRMEILSPGGIPDGLSLEEITDGMTAVRNPQLVHILDKLKYIENYGTGIRRMYNAYDGTDKKPIFEVRPNSFKVTLPNLNWSNSTVSNMTNSSLETNEDLIVEFLKQNGSQSKKEIQQNLNMSNYNIRKSLNILINQGIIKRTGKSVKTRYLITRHNLK
ncbi:MAG TPA: putative DNA binding domain-containing protein [Candidatus Companilactobacillus pullicola]|uniref:DNA binding domain-containing protein n=1 Tax=Candidatus Companilactobacillus pullicola TaxID=2838523 RepID=A0A9D1ZMW2_9LACO|nr:putative DNA binding domain-containing protein [Candidatus Companilactobacillus pullicola]